METKISGVYKITNNITNDFYIGSSKNIKQRWYGHRNSSNWKQQPNSKLYQDMAKYGLDNFTFEIVEETSLLKEREQYFINLLKPTYNSNRANGWDVERYRKCKRDYYKEYRQTDKCKDSQRKSTKRYFNQFCLYEGERLTLGALKSRFQKQCIPHPTLEAKKYLLKK